MVLVAYSDSEGSDNEEIQNQIKKPTPKPVAQSANFAVDKANPKKIRINLTESLPPANNREHDDEPAAKRPRVGKGAFSGFNAMLPAPKRDTLNTKPTNGTKTSTRKIFSLKTGAEPAFSRDADAEMRELFTEQGNNNGAEDVDLTSTIPPAIPKPQFSSEPSTSTPSSGKAFMFKPLSVARNTKKKKPTSQISLPVTDSNITQFSTKVIPQNPKSTSPKLPDLPKKLSLFSAGLFELPPDLDEDVGADEEEEIVEVLDDLSPSQAGLHTSVTSSAQPQSLSDIADNLNLTASQRRQLLGRNADISNSKIINFSTDVEYAANQAHIAAGEQIQHNPVRTIASGKHSLKQLVANAQDQKDALEESFASGKRNKREAGSKYGW